MLHLPLDSPRTLQDTWNFVLSDNISGSYGKLSVTPIHAGWFTFTSLLLKIVAINFKNDKAENQNEEEGEVNMLNTNFTDSQTVSELSQLQGKEGS